MDEVLNDQRFAHIAKDPRYRRIPREERKVKIDKRFQTMFSDKRFKLKYSVDKRGKPVNLTSNENLKKYYALSDEDNSSSEEEDDSDEEEEGDVEEDSDEEEGDVEEEEGDRDDESEEESDAGMSEIQTNLFSTGASWAPKTKWLGAQPKPKGPRIRRKMKPISIPLPSFRFTHNWSQRSL